MYCTRKSCLTNLSLSMKKIKFNYHIIMRVSHLVLPSSYSIFKVTTWWHIHKERWLHLCLIWHIYIYSLYNKARDMHVYGKISIYKLSEDEKKKGKKKKRLPWNISAELISSTPIEEFKKNWKMDYIFCSWGSKSLYRYKSEWSKN